VGIIILMVFSAPETTRRIRRSVLTTKSWAFLGAYVSTILFISKPEM
jgi:hypothetical protein